MKKVLLLILTAFITLQLAAQPPEGFNPKRFQQEMEQFITREAGLTPAEAARFFPIFNELQQKQRKLFDKMRFMRFVNINDDAAAHKAIVEMDRLDLQIKKLQQQYHEKFCKVLPAGKVLKIIKADEMFHRTAFKRFVKKHSMR